MVILEPANNATEEIYYELKDAQLADRGEATRIPDYSYDNGIGGNPEDAAFSADSSQKLYKLNSSTNKTGLGISLKVMAGDKIDVFGKSYYFQNNAGGSGANSAIPVLELLSGLLGTPGGAAAGGHTTASELNGIPGVTSPLSATYLNDPARDDPGYSTRPRAFINYVFLDEQFKFVAGGFSAVNNTPELKDHYSELQNKVAQKNGYVYIYVSNESPVNVFFDNLQVVHTRGAILEETHYYPFGLTMKGISPRSLAFGKPENKEKTFQGQRFDDELGLNWIQFKWRNHDPQIGRFVEIDPLSEKYVYNSTYAFSENKVINHNELEGLEATAPGYLREGLSQLGTGLANAIDKVTSFFTKSIVEVIKPSSHTTASTVFTTTSKTEYGTNILAWALHSKNPGATVSNGPSIFKAETEITFKAELVQEVTVNNVKVSSKTSLDGSSLEVEASKKSVYRKVPLFTSISNFVDFQKKEVGNKVKVGIGTDNNQLIGELEISKKDNNRTVTISIGAEEKSGNIKKSFLIGKSF